MIYVIYLYMGRELYHDKYLMGSLRLPDWDYRTEARYFITVRTKERGNILGKIINGEMIPNQIGIITNKIILDIPDHFPHVILHEHVVMPDHVHILLEINKRTVDAVETHHGVSLRKYSQPNASRHGVRRQMVTGHHLSQQIHRPQKGSISIVINQFKGATVRYCNKHHIRFAWQGNYYDRIIRNEWELANTKNYIRNNPKNCHHSS